ncbi:hypothetical protein JMN32_07235 [Fulvivirga sp. 29W222]|uniref:Uncharacterized protein n=1 Tax=Fulvivirga marina TaxID=2494733 RepID=A0A937FUF6_9BACT|nr:hypothetical protein [Fulvivirga marina]MBL6446094.1 hypothetical protein [Fulvivirga marina]
MNLFKNESILVKSESEVVVLTTHRLRYQDKKELTSIMLKQISSIDIKYTSHPLLIILAVITGLEGIVILSNSETEIAILALFSAGILAALFLSSRKHVVTISSASSRLVFHTKGMGEQSVESFVDKVEAAIAEL